MRPPFEDWIDVLITHLPDDVSAGARLGGKYELFMLVRVFSPKFPNTLELHVRALSDDWCCIGVWTKGDVPSKIIRGAKQLGWKMVGQKTVTGNQPMVMPQ